MVNVLIKKIDNVNSANIHSVNLWIVQLTISSHCKQKLFNLDTITYTLCSKICSVCNRNCNYLSASVCSERNLILVPLKYKTDSIHDCKPTIFFYTGMHSLNLKWLNLICQINRFKPVTLESKNRMILLDRPFCPRQNCSIKQIDPSVRSFWLAINGLKV